MTSQARATESSTIEQSSKAIEQQRPMGEPERNVLLRSVIASQALEGVYISYKDAAQLLDEVLAEPLIDLR